MSVARPTPPVATEVAAEVANADIPFSVAANPVPTLDNPSFLPISVKPSVGRFKLLI